MKRLEALGGALLSMFVPKVDAAAGCGAWPACWQCNRAYGGACRCNAPCTGCTYPDGSYDLLCRCGEC